MLKSVDNMPPPVSLLGYSYKAVNQLKSAATRARPQSIEPLDQDDVLWGSLSSDVLAQVNMTLSLEQHYHPWTVGVSGGVRFATIAITVSP